MTLTAGTRLGPYEITSQLGAGGMGEVWRARDTRLNREVAIKVLPASFANDEDRLRRFEQEALATSALNHPNILTIYDIGTHEHSPYIVAELLEGADLRAQLNDEALTVRKAIDYAQQITRGLAAAHEKGIVHRDLKPENLFITKDGRVKILDFGLAKLTQPKLGHVDTAAPTSPLLTESGVVMGTVFYLSPEQTRGERADYRTDIFAFGAILYEMVIGQRAFQGKSPVEVMNAILKEEPPELSETSHKIPPQLERIVRRCLEKRPERRFQSASDLGFALEALTTPSGSRLETAGSLPGVMERASKRRLFGDGRLAWIVAVLAVLAALFFAAAYFRHAPADSHATYLYLPLPEKTKIYTTGGSAISPDGRRVVIAAAGGLWLYSFDAPAPLLLQGTEDAGMPFWSPDGRSIGFSAQGKLKRIEFSGGMVTTLCDSSFIYGGAWSSTGVILFSPASWGYGLYRVSESGGTATPVTSLDAARLEMGQSFPSFLPDGRHFIFFSKAGQPEYRGIRLGSLDSSQTSFLFRADAKAEYSTAGYLLFMRARKILAQKFDPEKLLITGDPVVVIEQAHNDVNNLGADLSVSGDRALLYCRGGSLDGQLVWFDRNGRQLAAVGPAAEYFSLQLSPDGQQALLERNDPQVEQNDIWQLDLRRETLTRLTSNPARDLNPLWSPDQSRVVFTSNREGFWDIYQKGVIGDDKEELLLRKDQRLLWTSDWSRDGKYIVYSKLNEKTGRDIIVLNLSGDHQPHNYLATQFYESWGKVSPDGRWLAYQSTESGRDEIYVQAFPETGRKVAVSKGGGQFPRWRSDGKELYYIAADNRLMAVPVETGARFAAGTPVPLFEVGSYGRRANRYVYDVSVDGERFLVIRPLEDASARPLTVVQNWTAELKKN